jgi:hypothetical protein
VHNITLAVAAIRSFLLLFAHPVSVMAIYMMILGSFIQAICLSESARLICALFILLLLLVITALLLKWLMSPKVEK